jgi:hypothetical protein
MRLVNAMGWVADDAHCIERAERTSPPYSGLNLKTDPLCFDLRISLKANTKKIRPLETSINFMFMDINSTNMLRNLQQILRTTQL